ncbi:MAG: glycoside hydrolase family 78 protein [Verrucomicrobiae bacterium]|nr:glycoside hydrolase family 78 protein [Verrucomicrobiae bacterium]MDW8345075.1 family 78 glycoside hydrolase catalytic domain [Verrucomicrobiae bacterium]
MQMHTSRGKSVRAQWIGFPNVFARDWRAKVLPAPFLRREFESSRAGEAKLRVCGLGYHEVWLNGERVGDTVLEPVVTQYDKRVRFVSYRVNLRAGRNALGVILGNGWYNSHTAEVWHFDKAPWRDYPKLWLELEQDGRLVVVSDGTWRVTTGPILFDGLRNGETYDARRELGDWTSPGYDDSSWEAVGLVAPPGGVMEEQTMPGCRIVARLSAVRQWTLPDGTRMFDFGQNIAGWAELATRGPAGTEMVLQYGERLGSDGRLDQRDIGRFVLQGDFQTDRYILKGVGVERWAPRFTYHGFQYVAVSGAAEVVELTACVVRTGFERIGWFECSDPDLNALEACTVRSYESNFVGIPTDCPHREKNGWTGDAQVAVETGLFHFEAGLSYRHWVQTLVDTQRPSGQLPGIAPSAGWGYNWGNGPAWDSALVIIPWQVYVFEGDTKILECAYDAMRRYVDYLTSRAEDSIVAFGLGDWCHPDKSRMPPVELTSTIYYYLDALLLSRCAQVLGHVEDSHSYEALAEEIGASFHRNFYRGNGVYGNGEATSLGGALANGLVPREEREAVLRNLISAVQGNNYKADFGILGAKWIPRALAEEGYAEVAYRIITQPDYPGWMHWLKQGATTLWETWAGDTSRNHIMFGDISAWMFQYVAGLAPDPQRPAFRHFFVRPNPVGNLAWARTRRHLRAGTIEVRWERDRSHFQLTLLVPAGSTATVKLPDGTEQVVGSGRSELRCELPL